MSQYTRTFEELLDGLLSDYKNQFPDVDTSKGSLIYMRAVALASALWGLYKYQDYISLQFFPDTADSDNLEHWASIYGLSRKTGEADADLLSRLLNRIQEPPAGGNKNDYVQWALQTDNVARAYCYPLYLGLGTVGLLVLASEVNTGSEVPSSHSDITGTNDSVPGGELVDSGATFQTDGVKQGDLVLNTSTGLSARVASVYSGTTLILDTDIFTETGQGYIVRSLTEEVRLYIEDLQPILPDNGLGVFGPTIATQDVSMTVSSDDADTAQITSDIEVYMTALAPNQTLYISQLQAIAIQNGADNAVITAPAADVDPGSYEMIRPGTVTINAA